MMAPMMSAKRKSQRFNNLDSVFMIRFRFLMYRFRPDTWWWGNIYLLRQTLLAFASSMPADDPHGQIIFTICILSIYMLFLSRYWPWKNHSLNMLDAGSTLMMLLVISTATAFLPESPSKDFYVVFLIGLLCILGLYIIGFIVTALRVFLTKGVTGEFGNESTSSGVFVEGHTVEELTNKWLAVTGLVVKLGYSKCESMVRTMNGYDREAILKSLVVWESLAGDFLSPAAMKTMSIAGKDTATWRLRNLENTTSRISKTSKDASVDNSFDEDGSPDAKNGTNSEPKLVEQAPPPQTFPANEDGLNFSPRSMYEACRPSPRGTPRFHGGSVNTPPETPVTTPRVYTPR